MKFPRHIRFSYKLRVVSAVLLLGILLTIVLLLGILLTMPQWWGPIAAASVVSATETNLVVPVDPRATFLHAAISEDSEISDQPFTPTVVDLAQAGLTPGTEIRLTYQVLRPFSFVCSSEIPGADDPLFIAVFSKSNNLLLPREAHRVPDAIKAGDEIRTGPVGIAHMSEPDDIAEDFQILPTSGTTIRIPEGASHLFLGIVDSYYKDNCGQLTVTIERAQSYDICLQDDASGDTLLFNSFTGDYRLIRCGKDGFTHVGTGGKRAISRKGCTITLNDALVSAVVDVCHHRGSATVKNPSLIGPAYVIQDNYTKDNTCGCPSE